MTGLILIPAFNEEKVIERVLSKLPRKVMSIKLDTLVVNDGSTDNTIKKIKSFKKIFIANHPINRGLGAALATGFEFAKLKQYDFLVTLDSDGQHDPAEIQNLIKPIFIEKADFVVGTRFFNSKMPLTRKLITFFATLATYLFTGIWTSDSQSGFRVFSKKAITKINIKVDRMEVSSDFFTQSRENNLKIIEVPIKPIYTKYSFAKGQNFFNSFNIIGKLVFLKLIK